MEINSVSSNSDVSSTKKTRPLEEEVERLKIQQQEIQAQFQEKIDSNIEARTLEQEQAKSSDENIGKNIDFSG